MMRGLGGRPHQRRRPGDRRRKAALDDALAYAQTRESFGKPIWQHQAVGHLLADMATKYAAAHQLLLYAARVIDTGAAGRHGSRNAKLFASEAAMQITVDAIRVHGGMG